MKKYNIFENRPELTPSEIEKGMDFNKIKMNAAAKPTLSLTKILVGGGIGRRYRSCRCYYYSRASLK
jgi:hypothetical protein